MRICVVPMIFQGVNEGDNPMDVVASHQRLLVGSILRTSGHILELGVGWYSTPIIHEISEALGRPATTVDNSAYWLAQFKGLATKNHTFMTVGWWGELWRLLPRELDIGLVFVDQGQAIEREYAVRALLDRSKPPKVFVMHDTEEGFAYGYDRLLGDVRYPKGHPNAPRDEKWQGKSYGMFEYQYTDQCQKVWTTVCSQTVDVTKWFKDLPPVEPSKEVT